MVDQQHDNGEHDAEDSSDPDDAAFPVIPAELGIDPLLAALLHCAAFLDFAGDADLNPDRASAALEHVGLYVQRLEPARLERIEAQLAELAAYAARSGWEPHLIEFIEDFLYSCGIGDDADD